MRLTVRWEIGRMGMSARLARTLGLDGNPLRRASDRAEARFRVGLLAVYLTAEPAVAVAVRGWGRFLTATAGGWLPPQMTAELLGCYGIPLAGGNAEATGDAAGAEASMGVVQDEVFGPLVPFVTGDAGDVSADRSVRLAPLTSRELPDPVVFDQLEDRGVRYGLFMDDVISGMGGSP
jgi:hypothetical protein